VCKGFEGKYYPNGDLIDTVFPGETSLTWKAIEHGLEQVKKRCHMAHRVGAQGKYLERSVDTETTII
jgi:hypothetical protein